MEMAFGIFALVADWISGITRSDWKFFLMVGGAIWLLSFIKKMNERRETGFAKELERNDELADAAPEGHQLKWHVQHIREDLSLLCFLMMLSIMAQFF
jgi:hypothetical protein